jgi:hypothetical protein
MITGRLRVGALAVVFLAAGVGAVVAPPAGAQEGPRGGTVQGPGNYINPDGVPYSVDPLPPIPKPAPGSPTAAALPAPLPNAQTFQLHSLPGSSKVIYLDFDGQTVTGSHWSTDGHLPNSLVAPAYDTNGNPASWSQAEIDVIQSVWQRVSEDYSPWDVDVTTQDPGPAALDHANAADTLYGARVVITNWKGLNGIDCTCGGVAYIDTMTSTNSVSYQPAWIYAGNLLGAKNLAEAASHEVGHNLGLVHDSTKDDKTGYYQPTTGLFGPIMGAAYNAPVSQFSKGEYPNAWNQTVAQNPVQISPPQDDLAIIGTHGFTVRTDDYGGLGSGAQPLGTSPWSRTGVIETASDTDAFSFTAAAPGTLHIVAEPAPVSPNLDLRLGLLVRSAPDAYSGVTTVDPPAERVNLDVASGMNATIDLHINAGVYNLVLDGVGAGSLSSGGYSDYDSLGQYSLVGSFTPDPATVPSAPTGVSVAHSMTTAVVSFNPGPTGGSPPDGFYALCSSSDGGTGRAGTLTGSPIAVVKLTAGKHYTCKVRATNAVGTGAYSVPSAGFQVTTVPLAPVAVAATSVGTTATVSFTPAFDGGSSVTSDYVLCSSTDGGKARANTGPSSPIQVSKLSPGKTYSCRVKATNAVGTGSYSLSSSPFEVITAPAAPTGVVVALSGSTAVASFGSAAPNGSPVTQYYVLCSSSDGGTGRAGTAAGSPVSVTKLTLGRTYSCRARATNGAGTGPYSLPSTSFMVS